MILPLITFNIVKDSLKVMTKMVKFKNLGTICTSLLKLSDDKNIKANFLIFLINLNMVIK